MSEKVAALEAGIAEAAGELATWRSFMEHPGWKKLERWAQEEKSLRAFTILNSPIQQLGQVYSQEFMKGEGSGFGLILAFPATQAESLKIEIQKLEVMRERAQDAVQQTAPAAARSRVESDDFSS